MDRATLPYGKSTISCTLSIIIRQLSSVDSKLLTDRQPSVISTYLNDNAQTPLGQFVIYILCKPVCNKYSDKSNPWSL